MDFYDWRKGIVARLTQPYRVENPRWNRTTFIPEGTTFRTVHTRRGNSRYFSIPAVILDDIYLPDANMTGTEHSLYPEANFLFAVADASPLHAELVDDSDAVEEYFAIERGDRLEEAHPYLQRGKAVNYLVQLANKGFRERPMLLRRGADTLHEVTISADWFVNVARVVNVKIAEHAVRGMKTRIKQNLTPDHVFGWFATVSRFYPKEEGEQRMRADYNEFRRMLSPGALSASYLTEAKTGLVHPPGLDCASFYAFLHSDEDRVLMRIAYADDLVVQDLTA